MTKITQFPSLNERIFSSARSIIEERSRVYNYDPDLVSMAEMKLKEIIEKYGVLPSFDVSMTLKSCCEEDTQEIKNALMAVRSNCLEKLQELASEIVRLEIERCEILYETEKRKKQLRLVKFDE